MISMFSFLWHVKCCNIWSFPFVFNNSPFVWYNFQFVLYNFSFVLCNFLFVLYFIYLYYRYIISYLYLISIYIYIFHLYTIMFHLYSIMFHLYCIISSPELKAQVSYSDRLLSVVCLTSGICLLDFYIFDFFSRTAGPIVTKVGTNHP
jgi:presenilin-like A22 family membrane protease